MNKIPSSMLGSVSTVFFLLAGQQQASADTSISKTLATPSSAEVSQRDDLSTSKPNAHDSIMISLNDEIPELSLPTPTTPQPQSPERYRQYMIKGLNLNLPDPSNTIDPEANGFRSKMADKGFYWLGATNPILSYDFRNHGRVGEDQAYMGQKDTFAAYNFVYLTYDMGHWGLDGGQLVGSVIHTSTNWEPAGPSGTRVGELRYFQSLFDGKAEFMIGYLGNDFIYNGIYVGGNLQGGTFGVGASIPMQTGQGSTRLTRPGANLKVHLGGGFYNLAGVQRSVNPLGVIEEAEENRSHGGLGWDGDNVGTLYLEEFGYRREATPGNPATWIRAGHTRNDSGYQSLKNPGTLDDNYSWTLLGDRQLWQASSDTGMAYRGIYAGFSAMYAPSDVNVFSKYYEFRLYSLGPFASRPGDMVSFVVNQNRFSKYAVNAADAAGSRTVDDATSISLSYTANVAPGIFISGALGHVDHPRPVATVPEQRAAFTGTLNATIFF